MLVNARIRAFGLLAAMLALPAWATFHLMKIVEIFPGTAASPNAQYVVIQMYASGQNFVGGHAITVFNAAGTLVSTFTFAGDVANGANQAKILIATPEAQAFFGMSADLTMSAALLSAGGKVCWAGTIDCVAWGAYTGSSSGVGTPYHASSGLRSGKAAIRRLDISGSTSVLDAGDDTDNSANDFFEGIPAPRNNAGILGSIPSATCGNGVLEGLEECDDHNLTSGDGCSATCTIDTALPKLSIADLAIAEGNSGTKLATFTVKLSAASANAVTYNIATANGTATAGSDYVASSLVGQSIAAGQTSKTFTVTINGDTAVEPNETFKVNLGSAVGATIADSQAIGTLLNDDGPTLSIGDLAIAEGNSGTKLATFTVKLSQVSASPTTYNIATANGTAAAGSDYVANSLVGQSIPAGQTSKTFAVTVNGDVTLEQNETLLVNLGTAVGATIFDNQAKGTVLNDDGPTLSIADVAVTEGNTGTKLATFTVKLSQVSAAPVTYSIATGNGSATAGSDYVASSLTGQSIAAGLTSKTFAVTINGDTAVEPNEAFFVNLGSVVGATAFDGQAFGTILNDDGPTLSIADVAVTEGNTGTKLATFTVKLSQVSAAPVTYNIATANGTATAGSDYVASSLTGQSIAAGLTSKTFAVTINGDTTVEPSETYFVNMGNAVGATIFDRQAIGTISNDDVALATPTVQNSSGSNDAITIASLSLDGVFDHQADYAARLGNAANALCLAGVPMIIGVEHAGGRGMLADLTSAVDVGCAQHYRAFSADDAAGTMGFLVSASLVRQGVPQVELVSLTELGKTEWYRRSNGLLDALHPQAPVALALRVNGPDGSLVPMTVLLATMATEDPARQSSQARSLTRLVAGLRRDEPGLRLVMVREGNASSAGSGDLVDLTRRYNPRHEGQVEITDHILVSPNLLADYPQLHLTNPRSNAEPQVLVLPSH